MNQNKTPRWKKYTEEGYRNPDYDKFSKKVKFGILFVLMLFLLILVFYQDLSVLL